MERLHSTSDRKGRNVIKKTGSQVGKDRWMSKPANATYSDIKPIFGCLLRSESRTSNSTRGHRSINIKKKDKPIVSQITLHYSNTHTRTIFQIGDQWDHTLGLKHLLKCPSKKRWDYSYMKLKSHFLLQSLI